jgi:hypothetical protein
MAENLNQRWEASDELDFAWFGFASEYEKEQYRNAKDRQRMDALSIMMKAELIAKILSEELYCFGLRTAPTLSEGPERIPSFLFVELTKKGPLLENIDWDKSTLRSAGREYVQVRVFRPEEMENPDTAPEPGIIVPPHMSEASQTGEPLIEATPSQAITPQKDRLPVGRPSKSEQINEAIAKLTSEGVDLSKLPRKEAYARIRQKGEELGANVSVGFSEPVIQRVLFERFGPRA